MFGFATVHANVPPAGVPVACSVGWVGRGTERVGASRIATPTTSTVTVSLATTPLRVYVTVAEHVPGETVSRVAFALFPGLTPPWNRAALPFTVHA